MWWKKKEKKKEKKQQQNMWTHEPVWVSDPQLGPAGGSGPQVHPDLSIAEEAERSLSIGAQAVAQSVQQAVGEEQSAIHNEEQNKRGRWTGHLQPVVWHLF